MMDGWAGWPEGEDAIALGCMLDNEGVDPGVRAGRQAGSSAGARKSSRQ
jgi:hypothetical protein